MLRGNVLYRGKIVEAGVAFEDGVISEIGKLVDGRRVRGLILPAAVDVHVHFRDFGESHKETIETGSLAALHGGVCLVVDQPNTKPPVDNPETYERRMRKAEKRCYVDYSLNIALTKRNVSKINDYLERIRRKFFVPAVGEVFLQHPELQVDYEDLLGVKHSVTVHAEDPRYVCEGSPNFLFRPEEAEIVAVEKCLRLRRKFHFCHVSTRKAAATIAASSSSFEVTPHHMLLSVEDFGRLGYLANVNPPLRSRRDALWLLRNLEKVDVIASDHAPHLLEEKMEGAPGFPGVETMYPTLVYMASRGLIDFATLAEKIAENPAKVFGFDRYGEIEVGKFANLAIFDLREVSEVRAENLHSLCGWTPFEGFKAIFPKEVYLRGEQALGGEAMGRTLKLHF
ncbi:MAG: dihydroorotase [Archaeoglobaceae archaeon]